MSAALLATLYTRSSSTAPNSGLSSGGVAVPTKAAACEFVSVGMAFLPSGWPST